MSTPIQHINFASGGTVLTNAANIGDIYTTVSGIVGRVINSTALTNISVSGIEESIQFVETYKDFFHLDKHTSRSFIPHVVLSGSLPGSWWVRMNVPDPYWATVSGWYIDPAGTNTQPGNDENDGLTTASPIKSIAEWRRRIKGAVYLNDVFIRALSGSTVEDDGQFYGFTNPDLINYVRLTGTPTVIRTGTITSYTPYSGNTRGQLTDTSIPTSWTASNSISNSTGSKWIRKTGTGVRHYAHLLKDLGSKSVQFGIVVDWDETDSVTFRTTETNFTNGDTYEVVSLPTWPAPVNLTGNINFQCFDILGLISPQDIETINGIGQTKFRLCGFHQNMPFNGAVGVTMYSCIFCMTSPQGINISTSWTPVNCSLSNGAILQYNTIGNSFNGQTLISVGSEIRFWHGTAMGSCGNIRAFDCEQSIISIRHDATCRLNGTIVGSGNTNFIILCDTGGIFRGTTNGVGTPQILATTSLATPYSVNLVAYTLPVIDLSNGDGIY